MKTTRVGCTSPATPPKLRLDSFPSLMRPETPGMATPPIHLPGSVPFRWEEAPGRPRPLPRPDQIPAVDRTLDPPPRMRSSLDLASQLAEEIGVSPVLEGPYARILSARSFAVGRSTCGAREGRRKAGWSWRRKVRKRDHVVSGSEGISPSSSSSSSSSGSSSAVYSSSLYGYYDSSLCRFGCAAGLGEEEEEEGVEERLRTRRLGRSRSLTSFSSHATTTSSHWLANLYGILRQAIPRSKGH